MDATDYDKMTPQVRARLKDPASADPGVPFYESRYGVGRVVVWLPCAVVGLGGILWLLSRAAINVSDGAWVWALWFVLTISCAALGCVAGAIFDLAESRRAD